MKLVFIAGALNGANAWEVACNVHEAEAAALRVAELGGMPVVPHSAGRNLYGTLPEAFWREGCLLLLARCHGILLLTSWISSTGARGESKFAETNGIERWRATEIATPEFFNWLNDPNPNDRGRRGGR